MAKKRSAFARYITLGITALVVVCAFYLWSIWSGRGAPSGDARSQHKVIVERGAPFGEVAKALSDADVIAAPKLFRYYASIGGRDRLIKPGTYSFGTGASWRFVMDALISGKGLVRTVTIPEGFDSRQITPMLAKALAVPVDSVRAALADTALQRKLDIPINNLEGYLFPSTYSFPDGTSARDAIAVMVDAFEKVWESIPNSAARLQALAITRHDAMTMASIIETEARRAEERPIISAVYWNRIKQGMKLQADPTVQYALPEHVERVFYKDLEVDSKYNTYKYAGLPPGPIASPGQPSIEAALSPASVPYLFFVAHPDGHHEFRTTGAEHEVAKAQMKRERAKATAPKSTTPKQPASPPKKS